ncbi:MAG: NUDIX hydrolase [Thermoproteota archaeon]|nr:NUDIX hydrolase [Thermoproteota archaeon]
MNNNENRPRNPAPTIDVIIQENTNSNRILLVRRAKDPFKDHLSLPGGFVNYGETVEDAAKREAEEELAVKVELLDILGVYSDPERDPRGHIMSVTFIGKIVEGQVRANDDAAEFEWIDIEKMKDMQLAFDHSKILSDFKKWHSSKGTFWTSR